MPKRALIVVDMQEDFMPEGPLGVPGARDIVKPINRLMRRFELVVATQDWHPAEHGSFAVNHPGRRVGEVVDLAGVQQILWPVHCVQNRPGAEFVKRLSLRRIHRVVRKGTDPSVDSYSGFFDNGRKHATGLERILRDQGVEEVAVVGVATDYCVKYTALDAAELGFRTLLVEDACRGVELKPGDVELAIEQMQSAGVRLVSSEEF